MGAISCAAYTTDETTKNLIMDKMGMAGNFSEF